MAIAYYGHPISPNQTETAEGFLICRNVPIARTGPQDYLARELQLDGDPDQLVTVQRYPEDVFEAAALASFEGKPVTDGHPPENVGPENYAAYTKGHVQNVRRDGEYIVADLVINDGALASDVRNGVKREVSCGYLCQYTPDGAGYKQQRIRGNHVAVVPRGRAGREVAIQDAAAKAEKGLKQMKKETKEALYRFFGLAARGAEPEELEKLTQDVTTVATALDENPAALDAEPAEAEKPAPEAAPAEDVMVERAPRGDDLGSKLDKVIAMLAALEHKNDREEKKLSDEEDLDELVEKLSGGRKEGSVVVEEEDCAMSGPTRDAAIQMLKKARPAVAAIQDKRERARVVDALLSAVEAPGVMGSLMKAAQDSAKQAAVQKASYEQLCDESRKAYAARNPHNKKEEE